MALGVGFAAAGMFTSLMGAGEQQQAREESIAAQQRMEDIRQQAMRVDADRRRRQMVREYLIARSTALARGTAQGASAQGGSAMQGAFGQAAGRAAFGISGINQVEDFGNQMFAANRALLQAKLHMGDAQATSQMGSSLTSLGGAFLSHGGAMDRVFGGFGGEMQPMGLTGPSWFGSGGRSLYAR